MSSIEKNAQSVRRRAGSVRLRLSRYEETALPLRRQVGGSQRSIADVRAAALAAKNISGGFVLDGSFLADSGGLELLVELGAGRTDAPSLYTDGEGLDVTAVEQLRNTGVSRVVIPFHCGRQDAHDWLVGRSGALRAAHRAMRACVEVGMNVEAEVVVTRPTMPHLAETIEVLARLEVKNVCLRRLMEQDTRSRVDFVPLSVRLDLVREPLERAATRALERRLSLAIRDFPVCTSPRLSPLFAAPDSEMWVADDGATRMRSDAQAGCLECPGMPLCAGAPTDYVDRFGWQEIIDPEVSARRVPETVSDQQQWTSSAPMVLGWAGPHRVRCESCSDRGTGEEPTREVRARLVRAARLRPSGLRVAGADLLAHPDAASLLYDAVRLFPEVVVAGEASAIVDWSDLDLRRLKTLRRVDVAIFGPDATTHDAHCGIPGAFAAMLRAVERLGEAGIEVGAYAILHDATTVAAFAAAWAEGSLPGEPRFRLSSEGGSLDDLADAVVDLPAAARDAVERLLPKCFSGDAKTDVAVVVAKNGDEQTIESGRTVSYRASGSDSIGEFEGCLDDGVGCVVEDCPGIAVGWQSSARSKRWTVNT